MEEKRKAVWTGGVQVGLMTLPIRLHTAIRKSSNGSPNMISNCCGGFVGYDYKCKSCGKPVSKSDTKKGYTVGGQLVVIDPAELEALMPKSTKTIEVGGFAFATELDFIYTSLPYYTSPNTDPKKGGSPQALKVYHLIRYGCEVQGKIAFGQYVHKGKEYPCALRTYQGRLVLQQLAWSDQVVSPPEVEPCELTEREKELISELIEKLTKTLDHTKFENLYQKKVEALIEARASGQDITSPIEEAIKPTTDIVSALEASVEAVAVEA